MVVNRRTEMGGDVWPLSWHIARLDGRSLWEHYTEAHQKGYGQAVGTSTPEDLKEVWQNGELKGSLDKKWLFYFCFQNKYIYISYIYIYVFFGVSCFFIMFVSQV